MSEICFGVIINQIEGAYFSSFWRYLEDWASGKGVRLIFITGKALHAENKRDRIQNYTYGLLRNRQYDGLLVFSGSLGNDVESEKLEDFLTALEDVPLVSINSTMKDIASVVADSDKSIKELVRHLVQDHEYKKIGFVTGPINNFDSRLRWKAFSAALSDFGIDIPSEWIFHGDFSPRSGVDAALYFLDQNLPEALICLNDDMAHSLIDTFRKADIRVPVDIAVTGFDGFGYTNHMFPSLTTIEQPFCEIAKKAADTLLDAVRKGDLKKTVWTEECRIRIRQSCGCLVSPEGAGEDGVSARSEIRIAHRDNDRDFFKEQFRVIGDCLEKKISENKIHSHFSSELQSLLKVRPLEDQRKGADRLMSLYILNAAVSGQIQYKRTYDFFLHQWQFRNVSQRISGQLFLKDLLSELETSLPELGLDYCRFFLLPEYADCSDGIPDPPAGMLLHLRIEEGRKNLCSEQGEFFPLSEIFAVTCSSVIKTLFVGTEVYGFIQFGTGDHYDTLYESLREVISNALHQVLLHNAMLKVQRKLEISLTETRMLQNKFQKLSVRDEMTGVLNRRGFLEMAEAILGSAPEDENFYLFYLDLDGLKKINDTYGHKEGDWAIRSFAQVLENCFRSNDLIGRMGGDEFTALVKKGDAETVRLIRDRLSKGLEHINKSGVKDFPLETSVGHISFSKRKNSDLSDLINRADKALYREKKRKQGID
ncbi:MAG: GGDEF domain-containing protein [Spirochaetales bacterium]|nr:GGDEF domain-containing protein [Spirochaetales bacterium]